MTVYVHVQLILNKTRKEKKTFFSLKNPEKPSSCLIIFNGIVFRITLIFKLNNKRREERKYTSRQ